MLGSITRLGESGRRARWGVTVSWFALGALAGGAMTGGLAGLAGAPLASRLGVHAAVTLLALIAAAGLVLDAGVLPLPSPRRQVDRRWLDRYRGWVYGVSFGFQLGAGVVTVVNASAVYVMLAAAALSGSGAAGAAIGLVFGAARAVAVLPGGWVRQPSDLVRVDGRLRSWQRPARRVALAGHCAVLAGLAMAAVA